MDANDVRKVERMLTEVIKARNENKYDLESNWYARAKMTAHNIGMSDSVFKRMLTEARNVVEEF